MKNFLLILLTFLSFSLVLVAVPSVHAESFPSLFYCIGDTPGQNCITRTPSAVPSAAPTACVPPPQCKRNGVIICLQPAGGWCGFTPTSQPSTAVIPSTSPSVNSPSPATGNGSPSPSVTSPSPSVNPCVTRSSIDNVQIKRRAPMSRGALQQFIQLLIQLLQLLFQLLGGQIPTPTPTPTPTPSVAPSSSPSGQPSVSPNPCPSASPSTAPSTQPSTSPVPTVFGTSPSPTVSVSPSPKTSPSSAAPSTATSPSQAPATAGTTGLLESNINAAGTTTNPPNKLCLDDKSNGTADNNPAITWACNSADKAQKWTPWSDNTIRINGKCLDVNKEKVADRTAVNIFTCGTTTAKANQQWKLESNGKGGTQLRDMMTGTGTKNTTPECLDIKASSTANATQMEIFKCNGGGNQAWKWTTATLPPGGGSGGGGTTQTHSGQLKSGITSVQLCLDSKGNSAKNGTIAQTFKCSTADKAQQWIGYSDGTIKFTTGSGASAVTACLDVVGQGKTNGTNVDLYKCNGGANQVWTMNSSSQLVDKNSSKCLDIKGASTASPGPQLEIYTCKTSTDKTIANQQWSWGTFNNTGGGNGGGGTTVTQTHSGMIHSSLTGTATSKGVCLDAKGNTAASGTVVQTYNCNTADAAQQWKGYSDNTIKFTKGTTTACATANGTAVNLQPCKSGDTTQVWTPSGSSQLKNSSTGKCLDIKGESKGSPGPIDLYTCKASTDKSIANQQWSWQ